MKSGTKSSEFALALLAIAALSLADTPPEVEGSDAAQQKIREPTKLEKQTAVVETLTHKMMGHISLAQLAVALNLADEAMDQVKDAQAIESSLIEQMPQITIQSTFKYGKVSHDGRV